VLTRIFVRDIGILSFRDLRDRKPPSAPDRHDAEREARNQGDRRNGSDRQLQQVTDHHDRCRS